MRAGHPVLLILCFAAAAFIQGCGQSSNTSHDPTSTTTLPLTTSTTTATTTTLVDALNELYRRDDDGVFIRAMKSGYEKPWLGGGSHTSWAIFNKDAWDSTKNVLTMYGYGLLVGMIAVPRVKEEMARCMYPCDGGTDARVNAGCGCIPGRFECNQPDNADWCEANSLHAHGPGYICALHPTETARMLQVYKDIKSGKGPMWTQCQNQWIGDHTNAWNEVDIDTSKWNAVAHEKKIMAFTIPNECECEQNGCPKQDVARECMAMFRKMWGTWKAMYGEIPVVRVNRTNRMNPFSLFPNPSILDQDIDVVV